MSGFYSDFLSWGTAAALVAAIGMSSVPTPQPADADATIAVSRSDASPLSDAEALEARVAAVSTRLLRIEDIPQAELRAVNFTATEEGAAVDQTARRPFGTVTGSSVNLRAGPGTGFAVVGRGARSDELVVTGQTDGLWVEVELPFTADPAWIHGKYFVVEDVSVVAQN